MGGERQKEREQSVKEGKKVKLRRYCLISVF